jgi:uncharacterized protein with GYD domain
VGEGKFSMPLYLYQGAYTAESLAAQIKEPKDRIEVVKPVFEAIGGRVLASGHPFGEYDVVVVYEAPDDTAAASLALAIAAGGALRSAKTTRLLSGAEWVAALTKAQTAAPVYKPAR